MVSDAFFFFWILVFFFVLWFASGGPTKPISFAGPYISPITDVDTTQVGYGGDSTAYSPTGSGSVWADIMNIQDSVASLQRKSSEVRSFGEASPKRGLVTVSGYGGASATDPEQEYVTIRASGSESVDITGWRIVSGATKHYGRIPYGAALPKSGRVNDTDRIVLNPGDEAIIITGESPTGISFKENMCTGYFESRQKFYPALQDICPSASEEFERYYTGNKLRDDTCYSVMQSTSACQTPEETSRMTSTCLAFIDDYLNYNDCVATHRYDARFPGTTWRIYLELEDELWKPTRDAVKVLDENGLTVDLVTY